MALCVPKYMDQDEISFLPPSFHPLDVIPLTTSAGKKKHINEHFKALHHWCESALGKLCPITPTFARVEGKCRRDPRKLDVLDTRNSRRLGIWKQSTF